MIELEKHEHWQRAVEAIAGFISEGNFRFSDSGIFFRAIDPSQVVMIDYSIPKSLFEKYDIEPSMVGLDIAELSRILSRSMASDRLIMNLSDSELKIRFEGEMSRSFNLPLLDISEEEISLPETKFDARVEITGKILKEALKDASLLGTSVVFKAKSNEFVIEARGTAGNLNSVIKKPKHVAVKATGEVTSKYSLNFLQNIVKGADPEKKVVLELKTDAPMKISYTIGPSTINFHLAHMLL